MKKNQITNALLQAFDPITLFKIGELKKKKEELYVEYRVNEYKKKMRALSKKITMLRGNVGINKK